MYIFRPSYSEELTVRLLFSVLSIGWPEYAAWKSWKIFPNTIFLTGIYGPQNKWYQYEPVQDLLFFWTDLFRPIDPCFLIFLPYCTEWSLSSIHVHISYLEPPLFLTKFLKGPVTFIQLYILGCRLDMSTPWWLVGWDSPSPPSAPPTWNF